MRILIFLMGLLFFLSCSKELQEEEVSLGYTYYEKASAYIAERQIDSAFKMFDEARNIFMEENDSLNVANSLLRMAIIQRDQGDYFGAHETSLKAIGYLDQYNPSHRIYLSSAYNNLAMASSSLRDYDRAIDFYEYAYGFSDSSANTYLIRNNLASSYRRKGNYDKAFEIFQEVIQETENNNPKEYARVLSNYAMAKLQKDSTYNAAPELLDALYIRVDENDLNGLNASYAHLSDYYAENNPDSAIFYASKQYKIANKIKNPDSRLRALNRLIMLSPADSLKLYYEEYKHISDSLHNARAAAGNQFALIRYEVEKNKAENLRLEKISAERASRLARQRVFTAGTGILLLVTVIGGRYWYRKRQQRILLESQNRIKEHQVRTSKKVHDVVANGLYRVMSEIEYQEHLDRDSVLDRLEDMYHRSRDISYEVEHLAHGASERSFSEDVSSLLTSFASSDRRVLIAGNERTLWEQVRDDVRSELHHILLELMVNMKKHSQAHQVVVRFEITDHALHVHYSDDGVGMDDGVIFGNGLQNTENRILGLNGTLTFASGHGEGLKMTASIPLH